MGIQGWNGYVNNLDTAVTYTAAILGLKLQNVVNDLWPKMEDKLTPLKVLIGWIDGVLNAFPATSLIDQGNIAGFNIIASGLLAPPDPDDEYLRWSQIADQVGSVINGYKTAIGVYAKKVIDAPIADPQWGINRVLGGGTFLYRSTNFTQDDFDAWMYQSVEINAIGTILQAQNAYIIRTFNKTDCEETSDAVLCEMQPNSAWTEWRLHKKDSDDWPPESGLATKLIQSYGFTKQTLFKGPSNCFDWNDYVQLTNPWDSAAARGFSLDPWVACNFNLNVCNFDAAEDDKGIGDVERYVPGHTDNMCGREGIIWN
ncbi:uncharacterized protein GLRG_11974 [Colletotrichum graminicola M1.001]|uniref:DUF7872 domain-containing protein n=1 Tax=Colletotrichum graminicola (strain M1.001 / M2 / FGSC 10212) TaxID=645133 RepID=E3R139_COLGM|nr:uncharacterized protein GLRG_11974 [Colletotrichum graminicola M1.001]EFQ36827.1 hypothetical protein GLRG_11974 [Colletotrichum graminicola M1.001]